MPLSKLIFIFITTISLSLLASGSTEKTQDMSEAIDIVSNHYDDEFIRLFDYEIQNRAFARNGLEAAVRKNRGDKALPFNQAYLSLEMLNQERYRPMAQKYQLDMAPRWWTQMRTSLGEVASTLMPETSMTAIHKATLKYIPKLEQLARLAPADDKAFFDYVVAQEKAQADAMGLFLSGSPEQAATLLNTFVRNNR